MLTPDRSRFLVSLAALASLAVVADAQLLGTKMTGSLQLNGYSKNYFDPANDISYAYTTGSNKYQGTTVTVSGGGEFGYLYAFQGPEKSHRFNVSVRDSKISISSDNTTKDYEFTFRIVLTDPALEGVTLTSASSYSSMTYSLVGSTLSIFCPNTFSTYGSGSATFSLPERPPVVPEPTTYAAFGIGALVVVRRRKR